MAALLSNVQDVCLELGLPVPSVVAASTDDQTKQILALMNRAGDILSTEADWQTLSAEYRFLTNYYTHTGNVTTNGTTITGLSSTTGLTTDFMVTGQGIMQDTFITSVGANSVTLNCPMTDTASGVTLTFGQAKYAMPSDYARIVNKTQYNRSNRWAIIGPKSPQEWQWLKSSYISTGPRMRFRIIGNKFTVWPMPASNVVFGFEYQSQNWVQDVSGNGKSKFTVDTDTALFPDRLLILGTKLKYFEIKGFDTTALNADYQNELSKYKSVEGGADTLSLAPQFQSILLSQNNLPDTGYGNVAG
jgi:hypothetical protein